MQVGKVSVDTQQDDYDQNILLTGAALQMSSILLWKLWNVQKNSFHGILWTAPFLEPVLLVRNSNGKIRTFGYKTYNLR